MDVKPDKLIRPEIRALSAYHVPPARDVIKLDAMENPYRWPPQILDGWLEALREAKINRYPDPAMQGLKSQLRKSMHIPDGMQIILGNGSDELIQMICMAVAHPDRVVLAPEPSFVMYRMIAVMAGMRFVGVPLNTDFTLDEEKFLNAIEQHRPAVTFLAYPNNPTGNLFNRDTMARIIQAAEGLVVLDEAYHAFAQDTFMQDLSRYDNLLVMRTLSKMGLAGLRLGFLAGAQQWLQEFDKIRLPYNVNVLTQTSVEFALQHREVLDDQTAQLRDNRAAMYNELCNISGITCYPTDANFILFRTPNGKANAIFEDLLQRGILIKNLSGAGGLLADCLRVTVGTVEENEAFLRTIKDIMA
jgi:histidinol-phosphate aminotransferase